MMFCPLCGTERNDKYEATLCCDKMLPGEDLDAQLRRLFADEIQQAAVEIAEAPKPELDMKMLHKLFAVGKQFLVQKGDKYYSGRKLVVLSFDDYGPNFIDFNERLNRWSATLHCFGWEAVSDYVDRGNWMPHGSVKLNTGFKPGMKVAVDGYPDVAEVRRCLAHQTGLYVDLEPSVGLRHLWPVEQVRKHGKGKQSS